VIKYILDVVSKRSFKTENFDDQFPIVYWNEAEVHDTWEIWKTFALVCETLEEKQVFIFITTSCADPFLKFKLQIFVKGEPK